MGENIQQAIRHHLDQARTYREGYFGFVRIRGCEIQFEKNSNEIWIYFGGRSPDDILAKISEDHIRTRLSAKHSPLQVYFIELLFHVHDCPIKILKGIGVVELLYPGFGLSLEIHEEPTTLVWEISKQQFWTFTKEDKICDTFKW